MGKDGKGLGPLCWDNEGRRVQAFAAVYGRDREERCRFGHHGLCKLSYLYRPM